jgi:hypothetical protein
MVPSRMKTLRCLWSVPRSSVSLGGDRDRGADSARERLDSRLVRAH